MAECGKLTRMQGWGEVVSGEGMQERWDSPEGPLGEGQWSSWLKPGDHS